MVNRKNQYGWEAEIHRILGSVDSIRVNGKTASDRTLELTAQVMVSAIRTIRELGFKIENPVNISQKHLTALVQYWYYTRKKAMKTIVNDLSRIRQFMRIARKPGLVKHISDYLPDVPKEDLIVSTTAKASKSWATAGVNLPEAFSKADEHDKTLGMILRMEAVFGLRRIEALKCNPHYQDRGGYLEIPPGHAKGGRPRMIPVDTLAKREMLDFVKKHCPKTQHLGWQYNRNGTKATLKQNITRYNNAMQRLGFTKKASGVTGHGLRVQYAENAFVEKGILPATLTGQKKQTDRDDLKSKRVQVSEELGHHRPQVTSAYCGTLKRKPEESQEVLMAQTINDSLDYLSLTRQVPDDCADDISLIAGELASIGISVSSRQAHQLWSVWCQRNGTPWLSPTPGSITKAMEAAAATVILQNNNRQTDTGVTL